MRPCTPTTSVPSATGRQYRLRRRPKRARRQGQIGACTDPSTPVARRATAPERANAFLFGPCTARFSFGKTKREMGGASAQPSAWLPFPRPMGRTPPSPSCGSRLPPAAVRRPKKHPPCGGRSFVRSGQGFHSPHRLFFHLTGMVTGTSACAVREKVGHSHTSS